MKRTCISTLVLVLSAALGSGCTAHGDDGLRLSGWVEADMVKVVPLVGGRIVDLNLEEGALVKKGDPLAKIDCPELLLQLKQAEAALKGARAQQALVEQGARVEDKAQVREGAKQAAIAAKVAQADYQRAKALLAAQTITRQQYEDLVARRDAMHAQASAAKQQYSKVVTGARPEEKDAVGASVEQAEVMLSLTEQRLSFCNVLAPITGRVIHKLFEPGEVATPGSALGVLADLTKVKVKGFISEGALGRLKLGQLAKVYIDSMPDKPLPGKLTFISSEAEFTPKNIQTQNERIKVMYRVHVSVDNPDEQLKSGMPADVVLAK